MYHDPRDNFPRWLQVTIIGLIVYSTVMIMLETVPELEDYWPIFQVSEIVVVILFTVEYVVSWWLSSDRWRFPFRFMNLIDLAAILPFYLSLGTGFAVLRSLRLLRMFRLFKLARYSQAVKLLGDAFRRVGPELMMTGIVAIIAIVLSASALYFAEHDKQPENYTSIPETLWWAVTTLTTVGYGDVYPQTVMGRIVAAFIMICGIGMVAVPSGLLASSMTDILHERREQAGNRASK